MDYDGNPIDQSTSHRFRNDTSSTAHYSDLDEETLLEILSPGYLTDSLSSPSSISSYSDLESISEAILQVEVPTKISPCPSSVSLGKRKACSRSVSPEPSKLCQRAESDSSMTIDSDVSGVESSSSSSPSPSPSDPPSPEEIAHCSRWQPYFDRNLCYGVQYEIARLVTLGCFRYKDLCTDLLCNLSGPNAEAAPKTAETLAEIFVDGKLKGDAVSSKAVPSKSPWRELDKEIDMLSKNEFAGLGFSQEEPNWYGGKVEFRATLQDTSSTDIPQYKIVLQRPVLGTSCRFTRRFGSQSFLRVKIPSALLNKRDNDLVRFLSRPFILTGCVFRAFYAKKDHVFLFKTCEVYDGKNVSEPMVTGRKSDLTFQQFIDWHNPLQFNIRQSMTKWAARFALGLSNTVPGLRLTPDDILDEPDIVSTDGSDMTDGSGYINNVGLLRLQIHFLWQSFPTAVQCRLGGMKGLFSLHPDVEHSAEGNVKVWIRPSQYKIKYPIQEEPDPARLILDVVQPSRMKGGRLTSETVINLAENGVPPEVLVRLLREGLDEHVAGLIKWEGVDAMLDLWCNLAQKGGVTAARRARAAAGEARARGYRYTEDEDEDEDEDGLRESAEIQERANAWWLDEFSGNPSSLEEAIMILLDAGFTPRNCIALRAKLNKVVTKNISDYVLQHRIDVPMSCTAMLIPDPFGVLRPGEIHIKSSKRNLKVSGGLAEFITGEVLLTRYPCKLPTDIQKFVAVEKTELRSFVDVIVCSVQGDRRQADLLAGGDYDGDTGLAIWEPQIVEYFIPADLKHSYEPAEVAGYFSQENEKAVEFSQRVALEPPATKIRALQEVLLGGLRDSSVVGQYSGYHDSATYELGYADPVTVQLAYMFCKVLDGSKTGLVVLPAVLREHRNKWQGHTLYWKKTAEEKSKISEEEVDKLCRRKGPPFIMDIISREASKACKRKLDEIEQLFLFQRRDVMDDHLAAPWLNACKLAERYEVDEKRDRRCRDLKKIADHVQRMFGQYQSIVDKEDEISSSLRGKISQLSREFASRPSPENVLMDKRDICRLRASYAYYYDAKNHADWSFFPWDVAMRELCLIKADAIGSSKTVTMQFYERFQAKIWRQT